MWWFLVLALVASPRPPRGDRKPPQAPAAEQPQLPPEAVRERVETFLQTIDTPISAAEWRALGTGAAEVLEPIISNPDEFPTRRARALEGLVAAAPQRAAPLVGKLAQDEQEQPVVRVAAVHGAQHVLSSTRLVTELKPVLQNARDAGLRAAAADVLAKQGRKSGCDAVRAQAKREREDEKVAFEKPLERCK